MSDDRVLSSHVLTIRFDQLEDNVVNWRIEPDETIWKTRELSLIDLAECEAPLAAIGIRALWKLCADGLVFHALEQANDLRVEVGKRLAGGQELEGDQGELLGAPEGALLN